MGLQFTIRLKQERKSIDDMNNHFIHPTVYIAKKGLYTLLSRRIDPWNNAKYGLIIIFQIIGFPVNLGLYHISSFPSSGLCPPLKLGVSDPASNCWAFISCTCISGFIYSFFILCYFYLIITFLLFFIYMPFVGLLIFLPWRSKIPSKVP